MKEILLPVAGVIAFIVVVGIFTQKAKNLPLNLIPQVETKEVQIGNTKITAEIADTPQKRELGLSGRTSLADGRGMLFIFDQKKAFPSIWMKDMHFGIDIVWIADGKIAKIDDHVPAPVSGTPESELKIYYPDKPVDYVLEVPANFLEKSGVNVGASVDF